MPDKTTTSADAAAPLPLDWGHDISDISAGGLDVKRAATAAERVALAAALQILACETVQVSYRVTRAPAEGYRLKGKLNADVSQACVVTLAPVHETVTAAFDVDFRPEDEVRGMDGGAVDLDEDVEVEPVEGKWLAVGRIVFEELATGLNPYPRRPGAEFTPLADAAEPLKENPFAVLAKLKTAPKNAS